MNELTNSLISRRTVLRGALIGAFAVGVGALAGCSPSGTGSTTAASGELAALPSYIPITKGPTPDLPGNGIVQPVYYQPPAQADLFAAVKGTPGAGGSTSGFVVTYSSPPPANNSYLEFMNKEVGTSFDMQLVPGDSYASKFATMTAGGDIPDLVQFLTFAMPAQFPQLLQAQFQDISEYVSGDAISAYPNLANLPTNSWASARVNGRIWGVPEPRPAFGSILVCRPDIIEDLTGQEPAPQNEADFTEICKTVTDAKANRYAICGQGGAGAVDWGYDIIGAFFNVPNGWRIDGSKLVNKWETDEWIRTLSYIKKLWSAGYYHPDTPSLENSQAKTYISSGTVLMHMDGISALIDTTLPEGGYSGAIVPFNADGGPGINYQGSSSFAFSALRKASKTKVTDLLKVLDYLASPYGSQEYFKIRWGQEGVHYTLDGDTPTLTTAGESMVNASSLYRLTEGPQVLTSSKRIDEQLRRSHAWQTATQDMLLTNPVQNLYSQTASTSASANSAATDVFTSYILGRTDLDAVRTAIASWTSSVGNTMRDEYQKGLDQSA